ncbi:hypothetical protein ACMUMS_13750 [Acinetobacter courvalinii]|uniref:hypothetical protein n=1 Tax=Acinetobacter courvalinii TaxID=280147 RepID=UPI003A8693FF
MNNIQKLEQSITRLGIGEFLFIRYGYGIDEMQNILHFLNNLESQQILQIVYQHKEQESGNNLTDIIKIQKC